MLIVTGGVQRGTVAEAPVPNQPVHMLAPPTDPKSSETATVANSSALGASASGANGSIVDGTMMTDLDRVAQRLKPLGPFGDKNRPAPNFNAPPPEASRGPAQPTVLSPPHP